MDTLGGAGLARQTHGAETCRAAAATKRFAKSAIATDCVHHRPTRCSTSVQHMRRLRCANAAMTWVYDQYVTDEMLHQYQEEAQAERRGLWADRNPVEPWLWRRGYR
jgi:hypothetical protein